MIKFKIIEHAAGYLVAYGSFYGTLNECIEYCNNTRLESDTTIDIIDYYETNYVYAYYSTYHKKWII